MVCGERVAARTFAISGCNRVAAAQHLLGKVDVGVGTKALLVRTILTEDFDTTHVIGCYNDVAIWMRGARNICWRTFRSR